uniref:subunit 5 of NADH-plastoquinone oxidoreductase n=1 Tax=Klebsormidium dissectum TaxID=329816 RepID=UPI00286C71CA|nr:subunit 5 of NADH-plastoquinone oxidoreductase [Klebsormidium dissectum]YP_010932701.1 subunit 5 of NADH-plastoquinone oxidoreductase [Klebsormidium dissectum]WKT06471.1 subunit 5 of NADH-plastoquinone oxidoreductase [Klebsormidium dissectum]WKT06472.1 subunit 5 of NADH-plastoquinone oxidoreductase [Klebsormidium dissectum]
MNQWLYESAWLVPILPCFASLVAGGGLLVLRKATRSLREWHRAYLMGSLATSMVLSFLLAQGQLGGSGPYRWAMDWIVAGHLRLQIGYLVDPLSAMMLVLITTVGLVVMAYSHKYMAYDQGYVRFFTYLSLFTASMLGLVLSPNLVQVYVFWELVGMCSYLLIGFWPNRVGAAKACQKAFITNRIGDLGLLLGILGLYWTTGSLEFGEIAERLARLLSSQSLDLLFPTICCLLLLLGPFAKSAQVPLHVWLPDAMEGPTPISALIHAATMVAAGVFLIARICPIFQQLNVVMETMAWVGALTSVLGASIALTQTDLKKGLAYSTMSQLGYMVMAMGVGSYEAGLFHLVTHAYSKALLFLGAGSVIHGMEPVVGWDPAKSQNMLLMGGLRKFMPITATTFLLGTLSICGFPPLACFWSKDAILAGAWAAHPILWAIAWATAGMTGLYMLRIYLLTFEGRFRAGFLLPHQNQQKVKPREDIGMTACLLILAFPTAFIGWTNTPWFHLGSTPSPSLIAFGSMAVSSVGIALLGGCVAVLGYQRATLALSGLSKQWPQLYRASYNRWHIDEIYDKSWVRANQILAEGASALDSWWIDGVANGAGIIGLVSGQANKAWQRGNLTYYAFSMSIALVSLLATVNFSTAP